MNLIGIDPAFRKDGFAVCIIDEMREVSFRMFSSMLEFMEFSRSEDFPQNVLIGVENSNLQDATFDMQGTKAKVAKKSRDVGKNQAASQYTVWVCQFHFGLKRVVEISPKAKGRKWTHKEFLAVVRQEKHKVYGYNFKGRSDSSDSEQDKRDAYQIALQARRWGMAGRLRVV